MILKHRQTDPERDSHLPPVRRRDAQRSCTSPAGRASPRRPGNRFLALALGRLAHQSAFRLYDIISTRHILAERSLYFNLGYWDGLTSYDDACRRLAEVLGESAGMSPADEVVDCGFGFGDQDFYWLERFKPKRIIGLNITASQVAEARRRAAERLLPGAPRLACGSATAMPLPDACADLVTALETAFHYDTREAFFREAFRVLRPGGRLVTADPIARTDAARTLKVAVGEWLGRRFWQIPAANIHDRRE